MAITRFRSQNIISSTMQIQVDNRSYLEVTAVLRMRQAIQLAGEAKDKLNKHS